MPIVTTVALHPAQPIEIIINHTRYAQDITTLHILPAGEERETLTIVASDNSGVQAVFSAADMSRWPAWLAGNVPVSA